MTIVVVAGICVLVLLIAFLAPRLSHHAERGGAAPFSAGARAGSKAPGPLGRLFSKPFRSGQKAVHKSGSAGRRGRGKMPL